jgi:phage-related protein
MAAPAILRIDIVADATRAATGLGRVGDAAGRAGDQAERSGSKWKSFAKAAAVAVGAAALGGLVAMFKTGITEQKDFLSGQAQLANGIKSTGNAAHVSVQGLEDLASSIQNYSGQTDDSIVASEKLLLTFTNVRNEAGKNNDIFNQATKMTADMAAKMGGDASKYAVQLGKALNDPAKGLSKLTKIGVTFTAAQEKQVKAMVAAGDTVGAQKVIMAELRREFGGSAKAAGDTLPGQMERAKRSFEDTSQAVVAGLMPVLTALSGFLLHNVMPAFQAVMGFISKHQGLFAILAGVILTVVGVIKAWSIAQAILNSTLWANPVLLIVAGIIALGVAVVMAYKKSETFRKIVQAAFKGVVAAGKALWTGLKAAFNAVVKAMRALWTGIKTVFNAIVAVVRVAVKILYYWYVWPWVTATKVIMAAVRAIISWVPGAFRSIVNGIKTALSTLAGIIKAPFTAAWNWIKNTLVPAVKGSFNAVGAAISRGVANIAGVIKAPFSAAWTWIRTALVPAVKGSFNAVGSAIARGVANVAGAIKAPFSAAWSWIKTHVLSPIKNMFSGAASAIGRGLSGVTSAITAPFSAAWNWIKKHVIAPITSAGKTIGNSFKNAINAVIKGWNNLSFTIGGWKLPFPPHTKFPSITISTPNLPLLASGGVFNRATLAVVGEGRGTEVVAPEATIRAIMRAELANLQPTIIVQGALDPDAVARQIDSILTRRSRRMTGVRRDGVTA